MTRRTRTRWLLAAPVVAVLAVAGTVLAGRGSGHPSAPPTAAPAVPLYHLDADHPTYSDVNAFGQASGVVVTGKVASHTTNPGASAGNDGAGDPLPAIPHTDYTVTVLSSLKGGLAPGASIVVALIGGATPDGRFVLDGGPQLADGDSEMFFLTAGADGKYYPLAGGAAIADRQPDGSYLMSPEATGGGSLKVTESAVKGWSIPSNSVRPAISGRAVVGTKLTCAPGTWVGTPTPSLSVQWRRNGSDIPGAIALRYVAAKADVKKSLLCQVTATNGAGSGVAASDALKVGVLEDKTAPRVTIEKPARRKRGSAAAWRSVHGKVSDPGSGASGIARVRVNIVHRVGTRCAVYTPAGFKTMACRKARARWLATHLKGSRWSVSLRMLAPGSYVTRARAYDRAGNTRTVSLTIAVEQ